jgi:hypothetical protein
MVPRRWSGDRVGQLPTRQAATAAVLGAGCGLALARVDGFAWLALLATAPWLGLLAGRSGQAEDFNSLWRRHRDRFGFVWAQRLREQFNRSAANAGWAVSLGWSGLMVMSEGEQPAPEQTVAILQALLKRFEL